ncbi:hypothetical protein NDU88_008586 [Pleurodeles waltl]|uniref:Uncharacterized protein n=1 Tax=Pleurodeles waltl TaxID=8319 RepID=A0AAV7RW65_PLEWA|nr:hypothetical protein NDU88_008586 [Pleurodeles waltl]
MTDRPGPKNTSPEEKSGDPMLQDVLRAITAARVALEGKIDALATDLTVLRDDHRRLAEKVATTDRQLKELLPEDTPLHRGAIQSVVNSQMTAGLESNAVFYNLSAHGEHILPPQTTVYFQITITFSKRYCHQDVVNQEAGKPAQLSQNSHKCHLYSRSLKTNPMLRRLEIPQSSPM